MSSQAARQHRSGHPPRESGHASADRLDEIGTMYDRHGTALYRLAYTICLSVEPASLAVVQAFHDATDDVALAGVGTARQRVRHVLARLTYRACQPWQPLRRGSELHDPAGTAVVSSPLLPLDPQRRVLLALTLYGDHTYHEAALLLRMDPDTAAATLRQTLAADACNLPSNGASRSAP